jgi:hypothetical protein
MTVPDFVIAYVALIAGVIVVCVIVGAARTPKDWR